MSLDFTRPLIPTAQLIDRQRTPRRGEHLVPVATTTHGTRVSKQGDVTEDRTQRGQHRAQKVERRAIGNVREQEAIPFQHALRVRDSLERQQRNGSPRAVVRIDHYEMSRVVACLGQRVPGFADDEREVRDVVDAEPVPHHVDHLGVEVVGMLSRTRPGRGDVSRQRARTRAEMDRLQRTPRVEAGVDHVRDEQEVLELEVRRVRQIHI